MSFRMYTGKNTFDAAIDRLLPLYEGGHRLVISYSGGKDSTVLLELAIIAATMTNRLPVEVVMRDDEILIPGTAEVAERTAQRPEVDFHWLVAHQPCVNLFNREAPYFWAFDPRMEPDQWLRKFPDWATEIPELNIDGMTTPHRFPPDEGTNLYAVMGLRTTESRARLYGLYSSKGYITKPNRWGVANVRPIYDWKDSDVWKAIEDHGWDYNHAYDVLYRLGVSRVRLRLGPPTMTVEGADYMKNLAQGWPNWFNRLCKRLPGCRVTAQFGRAAVTPQRRLGETWESCFYRLCIDHAPEWIAGRAKHQIFKLLDAHGKHSTAPFPEFRPCKTCHGNIGSWRAVTNALYNGDPFSLKTHLPVIEPDFFREGAGKWGGKPSF